MNIDEIYDVIIVGAGPGGLNAALYASRSGLKTLIIEKEMAGGKINTTSKVENWLGTDLISGYELAEKMYKHAISYGAEYLNAEVIEIADLGYTKKVILKDKTELFSRTIVIATGMINRKPKDIINFEKFTNKGISYCGVCDAPFYKNKIVAVQGGGNTAFEEAEYISQFASKVYLIIRDGDITAEQITVDKVKTNKKIKIFLNTDILKLDGKDKIESLTIKNKKTKKETSFKCDGLFPMIGFVPITDFVSKLNITNKNGFIETNEVMMTEIKGIFAVGDIREKETRQIVTAASEGAIAARNIWILLN